MKKTAPASLLLAVTLMASLASCAPEPDATPEPSSSVSSTTPPATGSSTPTPTEAAPATRPALSDLVVTPDGVGSLVVGQPVPDEAPDVALMSWNPTYCADATPEGIEPPAEGAPYAGAWTANYPDSPSVLGDVTAPFNLSLEGGVEDGAISWINVWGSDVATETGISAGSSRSELEAAYSSFDVVAPGDVADVYVLRGAGSSELWIEVANAETSAGPDYWEGDTAEHVLWMRVVKAGFEPRSIAGGDGGGPCPV